MSMSKSRSYDSSHTFQPYRMTRECVKIPSTPHIPNIDAAIQTACHQHIDQHIPVHASRRHPVELPVEEDAEDDIPHPHSPLHAAVHLWIAALVFISRQNLSFIPPLMVTRCVFALLIFTDPSRAPVMQSELTGCTSMHTMPP